MLEQFSRTQYLLGEEAMEALAASRVAVFGLGGVGGFAVEALARAGVGSMDVIDNDLISTSNLNRQIFALHSTVGKKKTEVAKARILDINPACEVQTHELFYLPQTAEKIDLSEFDYIVDAVDTVSAKLHLIEKATGAGVPIISSMGTGNKLDATAFEVCDIFSTHSDALARVIRKELKKRNISSLKVVCSSQKAIVPDSEKRRTLLEAELTPDSSRRYIPGSVSFVPPVAGMILAGEVIKDLIRIKG